MVLQDPCGTAGGGQVTGTVKAAAQALRDHLRHQVLGLSAYAIKVPSLFRDVHEASRHAEVASLRSSAASRASSYEELAKYNAGLESYNDELSKEINRLKGELESALADKENLATRLNFYESLSQGAGPDSSEAATAAESEQEAPPESVEEAVLTAMQRYGTRLLFGSDVTRGVESLAADAGPPQKILNYLSVLADMAAAMEADGNLGCTPERWLLGRNCDASGESESVMRDSQQKKNRVWDAGGSQVLFNLHMKPSDGTSPDRCVRIYFAWDATRKKYVVGWVGRHP